MLISRAFGFIREVCRRFQSSLKVILWRAQGAKVGKNVRIFGLVYIDGPMRNLILGQGVTLNHGVYINCREVVTIGENCRISAGSKIISAGLDLERFPDKVHCAAPIVIEDEVWLGAASTVLGGCNIPSGAVIGAGGVVVTALKQRGLYVGVPVRCVRD